MANGPNQPGREAGLSPVNRFRELSFKLAGDSKAGLQAADFYAHYSCTTAKDQASAINFRVLDRDQQLTF